MKKEKDKKKKVQYKNYNKSVNVDLNDTNTYELCYSINEEGLRVFTGDLYEIILIERYAPEKDCKREFNPASIERIDSNGIVCLWDLVREQWYYIDWTRENIPIALHVNVTSKPKKNKSQKIKEELINDECAYDIKPVYNEDVEVIIDQNID
jgi:hypothetical protein